MKNTFFLFGSEACQTLLHEGKENLILKLLENKDSFSTFKFTEGETKPLELLKANNGFNEFAEIKENLYLAINNLKNLIFMNDSFFYLDITENAKTMFNDFSLYAVCTSSQSERLINTMEDLESEISKGLQICIEI